MTGLEIMLFFQNLRELLGNFPTQFFLFVSDKCADALAVTVPCFIYWCVSKKDGTFVMHKTDVYYIDEVDTVLFDTSPDTGRREFKVVGSKS